MLLVAELSRRIGRFDEARQLLVNATKEAATSLDEIIGYEVELVERRDTEPHYLPRGEEERCSALDSKRPEPPPKPDADYAPPAPRMKSAPLPPDELRP